MDAPNAQNQTSFAWGVLVGGQMIVTVAHSPNDQLTAAHAFQRVVIGIETSDGQKFPLFPQLMESMADVALLAALPGQHHLAFERWCQSVEPIDLATDDIAHGRTVAARALVRGHGWIDGNAQRSAHVQPSQLAMDIAEPFTPGMCGSPIVDGDGRMLGIVCGYHNQQKGIGVMPWLSRALPRWALDRIQQAQNRAGV